MVRQRQSSGVSAPIGVAGDASKSAPDAEGIYAEVAKILTSEEFARSQRLSRFLQFIVEETLAGREAQIKAYTIAIAVCDRNDQFDPALDPIVRIEAGRLRRALQHYYLTEGCGDAIVISVPKGAYRPVITMRDIEPSAGRDSSGLAPHSIARLSTGSQSFSNARSNDRRSPWLSAIIVAAVAVVSFALGITLFNRGHIEQQANAVPAIDNAAIAVPAINDQARSASQQTPILLILPFYTYGNDPDQRFFARRVTETVARRLAENSDLTIRRAMDGDGRAFLRHDRGAPIDLIVSGSVKQSDSLLQVFVQLTNVGGDTSVWSKKYVRELDATVDYQEEVARFVAAYVADMSTKVTLLMGE